MFVPRSRRRRTVIATISDVPYVRVITPHEFLDVQREGALRRLGRDWCVNENHLARHSLKCVEKLPALGRWHSEVTRGDCGLPNLEGIGPRRSSDTDASQALNPYSSSQDGAKKARGR